MEEMKISKGALLIMGSIFTVASLGLMFLSAEENMGIGTPVQLYFDPNNAIQHFRGVKIIPTEVSDDSSATIMKRGGLVGINTEYNFLLSGGNVNGNTIGGAVRTSSILGGKNNKIEHGSSETILGGKDNTIRNGNSNSILGGSGNTLEAGDGSVIFGGKGNKINGSYSSIVGGAGNEVKNGNAIAVGNSNIADGYNSVAMGSGSKVYGNNSFLWTDVGGSLSSHNVFVVKGQKGMVVNTNRAHSFAQLTVRGSLILYNDESEGLTCIPQRKGVLKVIDNGDKKCFCSCDGSKRNAIHDGVMCPFKCGGTEPESAMCGTANRVCDTDPYVYTGTCKTGTVVQGTGAFFVSTERNGNDFINYINWSCQSDTGAIESCRTRLEGNGCPNLGESSDYECIGSQNFGAAHIYEGSDKDLRETTTWKLYNKEDVGDNKCAYVCDDNYIVVGQRCEYCPAGELDEFGRCLNSSNCPDPARPVYNPGDKQCYPYGTCVKDSKYYDINNITNIVENLSDIVPLGKDNINIRCIDADNPEWGNVEKNTCTYSCDSNNGYYCNGYSCQKPFCPSVNNRGNNYIYIKHPGHHKFGGSIVVIHDEDLLPRNNGEYATSGDFYRVYGERSPDESGCYYRCEEKYRYYYDKDHPKRYICYKYACNTSYFFGDYDKYNGNPQGLFVSWNYKNYPTDFNTAKQGGNSCIRTCKSGIKITGYRPVDITSDDESKWGNLLFSSNNSKFCYNECNKNNREYLSGGDGKCYVCPNNKILTGLATGKINNKTYSEYMICKDACPDQKVWNSKYGCIDDCEEGTEWNNSQKKCVSKCNTSQKWDSTQKKCVSKCEVRQYWDTNTKQCISKCEDRQIWENGACVGIPGDAGCTTGKYNDNDGKCYSCADDDKELNDNWECVCKDNKKTLDDKNNCVDKVGQLELSISNTDLQGNTKVYKIGSGITYKVTITNIGNLKIKNITGTTYALSGGKERKPNIGLKYIGGLSTGASTDYTLTYTLTGKDFNGLNMGQTGSFTMKVTATGKVMDDYVKNLITNSPTFTVTIKKS